MLSIKLLIKRSFCSQIAKPRIAVAMSGGVDSSVSALLLKRQGFDIFGMYMHNWDPSDEIGKSACDSSKDYLDACNVCEKLGIKMHRVSFVKEYWTEIFEPMLDDYTHGYTPNPDVWCNQKIKFGVLLRKAEELGADYLATGHYAQTQKVDEKNVQLCRAIDEIKDQTYFLCTVGANELKKAIFPIGGLEKGAVRQIAVEEGLCTAEKRESMGLCFVGKRRFSQLIENYLPDAPGVFVDVDSGKVVGTHRGIHMFTRGQCARISGFPDKYFVVDFNMRQHQILVCLGSQHPALKTQQIIGEEAFWISGHPPAELSAGQKLSLQVKVRHAPQFYPCTVAYQNNRLVFDFNEPIRVVAPHQIIAMYQNNVCLGGSRVVNGSNRVFKRESVVNIHQSI